MVNVIRTISPELRLRGPAARGRSSSRDQTWAKLSIRVLARPCSPQEQSKVFELRDQRWQENVCHLRHPERWLCAWRALNAHIRSGKPSHQESEFSWRAFQRNFVHEYLLRRWDIGYWFKRIPICRIGFNFWSFFSTYIDWSKWDIDN